MVMGMGMVRAKVRVGCVARKHGQSKFMKSKLKCLGALVFGLPVDPRVSLKTNLKASKSSIL